MKILRITATIDPKSGGVAESILQMARATRAAKALGHIVEVVYIRCKASPTYAGETRQRHIL